MAWCLETKRKDRNNGRHNIWNCHENDNIPCAEGEKPPTGRFDKQAADAISYEKKAGEVSPEVLKALEVRAGAVDTLRAVEENANEEQLKGESAQGLTGLGFLGFVFSMLIIESTLSKKLLKLKIGLTVHRVRWSTWVSLAQDGRRALEKVFTGSSRLASKY
jgi:hypothetical protein